MLPNHDGTPRAPDEAPLGEAPAALGRVRSATTNGRRDGGVREAMPSSTGEAVVMAMRIATVGLGAGALLAFVTLALLELAHIQKGPPELMLWGAGAGLIVGIVFGVRAARRKPPVVETWVGDDGLARRMGDKLEVLRFAEVARVKHDELGIPQGRMVVEVFLDGRGKKIFEVGALLDGSTPSTVHGAHFYRAAMAAWEAWRTTRQPATSPAR